MLFVLKLWCSLKKKVITSNQSQILYFSSQNCSVSSKNKKKRLPPQSIAEFCNFCPNFVVITSNHSNFSLHTKIKVFSTKKKVFVSDRPQISLISSQTNIINLKNLYLIAQKFVMQSLKI